MPSNITPLARVLSLETSGPLCSVALHEGGELVAYTELAQEKSHAARLTLLIEQTLRQAQRRLDQVEAIAVSAGPGSYTGLRIGGATAKGLCFALDIPLLAVDTLLALALPLAQDPAFAPGTLFCPLLDARRQEVYWAWLTADLQWVRPPEPHIVTTDTLQTELAHRPVVAMGSGATKLAAAVPHPRLRAYPQAQPTARAVGALALQRPHLVDLAYFEPNYLKPFFTPAPKG
ncbi:MAG: tRNA (adenosine(37)-N6)-threonylcarbamoyltransferase complex dimerization subunit type 1 TsaB [Bernardetiaceae bacterium]|nr:tRNA (adenosine(37)-N6)-threonylcarbamoyltransferase complex dimerization subunit type 1 TsaB [Bernardetiaceae bacterium]